MSYYFQYATGVTAKVIGKPSCDYFYSAAKSLELKPEDVCILSFFLKLYSAFIFSYITYNFLHIS